MTAHDDVRNALALYCLHFDGGRFTDWAALFTDDARLVSHGVGSITASELTAFGIAVAETTAAAGLWTKHLTMNSVITIAGERATAVSDFVLIGGPAGNWSVLGTGTYRDTLVDDDGWRFHEREITFHGGQMPAAVRDMQSTVLDRVRLTTTTA